MSAYEIKGRFSDLEDGISSSARAFDWRPSELALQLKFVAFNYAINRDKAAGAPTRGQVLGEMDRLPEALLQDDESGSKAVLDEAIALSTGNDLAPFIKLQALDGSASLILPDRIDLIVAASKQKRALDFRGRRSQALSVGPVRSGLEVLKDSSRTELKRKLRALAKDRPKQVKDSTRRAKANLMAMLWIGDGRGGRNVGLAVGFDAPARWQLVQDVLDIIWPLNNGLMPGSKRADALNLIDQVLYYVDGVKVSTGTKRRKDGKLGAVGDDEQKGRGEGIDRNLFKDCLALRFQKLKLEQSRVHLEKRVGRYQAVLYDCPDYVTTRWMSLTIYALAPIKDWLAEVTRRLEQGDYRPTDTDVRRSTFSVLELPNAPKLGPKLSASAVAVRLLRAWHRFEREGKPAVHNKGKTSKPAEGIAPRKRGRPPKTSLHPRASRKSTRHL